MAYIVVRTGPNKGKKFEIGDSPITIGREETQIIQILDQGVSRAHAEIFRLGEMCFVRDLTSPNGTYVNDVKVGEESLKAADELLIGTTILVFKDDHPSRVIPGGSVEFEGEEGAKIETTTVELKVEEKTAAAKVLGQEVQSRNITLTHQVGRILRGGGDPGAAFEKTLELLAGAIGASQGYLFGVETDGKFVPRAVVEIEELGAEKKVSRTIANRVRQSAMPLLTSDATLDGRFNLSESIILKKIKSVICVPVLAGERMLTGIEEFDKVLPGIRYHHERADGSGFPYKLKNADLPPMARVVIVANAFDNLCSGGGPVGAPLSPKDVVKDMAQRGGKEFDDDVIRALVLCHRNGSLYGGPRS